MSILKWILIVLAASLLMTGCIYNKVREIEPDQSFDGLKHVFQERSNLNVVFVHGMGHHPFGEPMLLDYQIRIAKELGFEETDRKQDVEWKGGCQSRYSEYPYFSKQEKRLLNERQEAGQAICPLKIYEVIVGFIGWRQYQLPDSSKRLNLFELSWDRATERLQKTILELDEDYHETVELDDGLSPVEGGRDRELDRASINRWLKKFVNYKLGDPAVYLGTYGDSIRRVVAEGLSKISEAAEAQNRNAYSIVSDSLGSRIVFDTLGCALEGNNCKQIRSLPYFSEKNMNYLKRMATMTTQVYMNANQLPFLSLSGVRPPDEGESEIDWLNRFPCESGGPGLARVAKKRMESAEPITIVAFTDPNDALSYHLTERFRNKCTHLGGESKIPVRFINVRISNTTNYFGIFAHPGKAHSDGFTTNNDAVKLLVNGYEVVGGEF